MDEFRRLKVMYPTASTRELAEFQVFVKAMAAHREDGRGSENRGGDNRGDTGDDQRRGRHNSRKDLKDYREHRPDGRHSAGTRWDEKSDSSHSSSDSSRRDNQRRSHRRRKGKNRDSSADSSSPAPKQLPAPSLPRLQQVAFPTVHHPTPSEPASEKYSVLLSEISSRPSQREDVNRKCYASLDTKGLMKLPSIPFDIADGNSQMNLVNFTASLKEAVTQIRDLGEDFSEDGFWIPGWHKPLMRHVLNSVSHHHPAQVTKTKQMVRDAFARAEADERSGQPGRQVLEGILRALCLGLSPSTPHQALQQLRTFQVPEKTSFADFLPELRIAVMNVKDVALVPPDDSTMQVAVKASIDDQFATLAASIFAGRNRSAVPFGSVKELLDSLGDLTMNRTPATAATRLGPRKAGGGGAASGSARSGNVFPVGGKEKKSKLDDAWYWKHDEMEYEHIMAVLDKDGGFGQNLSDPAFYVRFPKLEERRAACDKFAKKCLNCGEDAHFARDCPHPFLNVSALINPDVGSSNGAETEKRWRTWQGRLKKFYTDRVKKLRRSNKSRK